MQTPPLHVENLPQAIREAKQQIRAALPNYAEAFADIEAEMRRKTAAIAAARNAGAPVIPILHYPDLDPALADSIRETGACIIRGVFPAHQATAWDAEITRYVEDNGLYDKLAHAAEDKYFGNLASAKPQIFGVYWSRPQVLARQAESLTEVRRFLNRLWKHEGWFDPNETPVYADRLRRRPPGSASLGLSPHVDGGSIERWLDTGFRKVYRHVFAGNWRDYDPFDAAHRTEVREFPSAAVCSMFRTFQGWTALTAQGQGDGTLQLIPIANAMAYLLLRALQDDVAEDDLCGARPGRALSVVPQWHEFLLDAVTPIPHMQPGDAVFWHSDVVHMVEDEHRGAGYSNVMYIGSTVGCPKNSAYLPGQAAAFLAGKTPPDFAPDNFEIDFKGRATIEDLTPLGRRQLGLA